MPSGRDLEEETMRIAEEEEKFVLAKWAFVRAENMSKNWIMAQKRETRKEADEKVHKIAMFHIF